MSCILFDVNALPRTVELTAISGSTTSLSVIPTQRTVSVSAECLNNVSFSAESKNSIGFTAALVCGNDLGQWEYLWASDHLLITSDGEKLLVKRNI